MKVPYFKMLFVLQKKKRADLEGDNYETVTMDLSEV